MGINKRTTCNPLWWLALCAGTASSTPKQAGRLKAEMIYALELFWRKKGWGRKGEGAECTSNSIIYHFLTKYSVGLRKRLTWASLSAAEGVNPCWLCLPKPSEVSHSLNSTASRAAGAGSEEEHSLLDHRITEPSSRTQSARQLKQGRCRGGSKC